MTHSRIILVGNGMAGVRLLEELRHIAPGQHHITVFGAEPHLPYNRVLLSPVLSGEQAPEDIVLRPQSWYDEQGIVLHRGRRVVAVDRRRRVVTADDGTQAPYDHLVLATGSTPFVPPVPGHTLPGVLAYRDLGDTQAMIDAATRHRHAVVVGGGLLGLEAASGLAQRGMQVTVVHLRPWLMERQLDAAAAALLQQALEARGLRFELGAQTRALRGDERVRALQLEDGRELPADLVVFAAGIRPHTALAERIGLLCQRGIVVHDTLQTVTDPRIWAVGECATHRGVSYGLVAPLYEQARVCATHLAQVGLGRYEGSRPSAQLKVSGISLFSAGDFEGGEGSEQILLSDPYAGVYKKLVIRDDRLVGACLYGDTGDGAWYLRLLREGVPLHGLRDRLLAGEAA